MRFVVLLFGFLGVILTGACGAGLLMLQEVGEFAKGSGLKDDQIEFLQTSLTGVQHNDAAAILFLAALYGLFGTFLGFLRCGKQGGTLLLVPVLFAAFMNPFSLALTWLQAFAGLLSMFVSPLPINATPAAKDDDE